MWAAAPAPAPVPARVHTVFYSCDLACALRACDAFLDDNDGVARHPRSSTLKNITAKIKHPEDGSEVSFSYYSTPLVTAEFHVLDRISVVETEAIEQILNDLLSSSFSFLTNQRVVRFVVPTRPPATFSVLVHRMVEKFPFSLFVIVSTSLMHVGAIGSRFVNQRVRGVAVEEPHDVHEFVKTFVAQSTEFARASRWDKVFQTSHALSFKICGTPVTVAMLSKSFIAIAAEQQRQVDVRAVLRKCAEIEAIRTNKVSLLFDMLFFEMSKLFAVS